MPPVRVAVLGGGIIGLSSAILAAESLPGIEVTVVAEKLTPHTTGDGSAGFCNPYLIGDTDPDTLRYWCQETFDYLFKILKSPEAGKYGIGLMTAYYLSETPIEKAPFADVFLNWRLVNDKDLVMFPKRYRYGSFYVTLYAECSKMLPVMMERFKARGGKIEQRKVMNLKEFIGRYDAVINCPGVEAANLVPDPDVLPIRGQTIRVSAPWIKNAVMTNEFYILPNSEIVVCGGTHQEGDWNTDISLEDRGHIWRGCCELVPSLKHAKIVKEWVGLRPGRSKPRLERETLANDAGEKIEVIHNYGHGGSGVTLFWGCAKDAVGLLKQALGASRL